MEKIDSQRGADRPRLEKFEIKKEQSTRLDKISSKQLRLAGVFGPSQSRTGE